jgi:hypothetical protein
VLLKFVEFELNDLQGLNFAIQPVSLCDYQVSGNVPLTLSNGFCEKANVVVRVFNTVKRSLQIIAQVEKLSLRFYLQMIETMIHRLVLNAS